MWRHSENAFTLCLLAVVLTACGGGDSGGTSVSFSQSGLGDPPGGCDLYVDTGASGADNGSSWSDAYNHLQDALDRANDNPGSDFAICIAEGVYYPDKGSNHTAGDVQESFTFAADNAQLYGGYPGGGGDREPGVNPTVLSGDIDQNDTTNADGVVLSNSDVSAPNSNHVIELIGDDGTPITTNTRLDGLYITAGDNRSGTGGYEAGGGLHCRVSTSGASCNPQLVRVVFQGNRAYTGGACRFLASSAGTVSPEFVNVQFRNNRANNVGAACEFDVGGSSSSGYPVFVNTVFDGNSGSEAFRGGAYSGATLKPDFINTVFVNNADPALYNYEDSASGAVNEPLLVNTIIWNQTTSITDNNATTTVRYSIIDGGWSGNGSNILTQDPKFVDATGSDGITGTPDDDLRIQSGSPAIDAGDQQALLADSVDLDHDGNTSEDTPLDLFEDPRVDGSDVDIGVHER